MSGQRADLIASLENSCPPNLAQGAIGGAEDQAGPVGLIAGEETTDRAGRAGRAAAEIRSARRNKRKLTDID